METKKGFSSIKLEKIKSWDSFISEVPKGLSDEELDKYTHDWLKNLKTNATKAPNLFKFFRKDLEKHAKL